MSAADHPSVGVLADSYHFLLGREDFTSLKDRASQLKHVHLAQPLGRSLPLEPEELFDGFMEELQSGGYDGRMSIEAYCQGSFRELAGRARNRLMDEWNRRMI
jgi:sugar phosphate isomerase/epimerase